MPSTASAEAMTVSGEDRERLLARLARVEGQLRGVQRMIREETSCERVVQQLAAARGGLHGAFCDLITCAFKAKVEELEGDPEALRGHLGELAELLKKYA